MVLKYDVKIQGVQPEIALIVPILKECFNKHDHELIITSVTRKSHMKNSLHYPGYAIDLASKNLDSTDTGKIFNDIVKQLSTQFDVIDENDHIHVEYQPNF